MLFRDLRTNTTVKGVIKIFFILMVMDIVYRLFLYPNIVANQQKDKKAEDNTNYVENDSPKMQDENGESVKITKQYQDDFMGDDFESPNPYMDPSNASHDDCIF